MKHKAFDQFARETAGTPTRRAVVQGIAAVLGAASAGFGVDAAVAKDRNKKREQRKRRKDKKKECDFRNRVCQAPLSACQTVACENHQCVSSTLPDGTSCGGGRTCAIGTCACPAGRTCEVAVSPSALNGWIGYNDENDQRDDAFVAFVTGPGNPPYGDGSAQLTVTGSQRRNLATYQFTATKLADITQFKFTTYNPSATNHGGPNASGYLHFNVDFNGSDTWQRRLVYLPSVNGAVQDNQWQEWDAIDNGDAQWSLSGGTWPGDGLPSSTLKSWSAILSQYPQVRIRVTDAFVGIRIGEPYPDGFTGNIGSFTFGTTATRTRFVFGPDA